MRYTIYMHKRGFTMIELTVAVVVLVLLSVLTALFVFKSRANAKLSRVSSELTSISTAVTQYAEDNNYQYPPDTSRGVPPGLEPYLQGGAWPESAWPNGVFDWDNWIAANGQQIYQITYRLCDVGDPVATCSDPVLFPNFTRNSGIYYCISGPCIPHQSEPTAPAYCVNCKPHEQNY